MGLINNCSTNMTQEVKFQGIAESELRRLQRKWAALLEGIENPYVRNILMPILLENTENEFRQQYSHLAGVYVTEADTTSANVQVTPVKILPLIRRAFPKLIATEIVSVQPLTGPVGAIFYLDAVYKTSKGTIQSGDRMFYLSPFDVNYTTSLKQESVELDLPANSNGFTYTILNKPIRRGSVTVKAKFGGDEIVATDNGQGLIQGGNNSVTVSGLINYDTGLLVVSASTDFDDAAYGANEDVIVTYEYFVEGTNLNIARVGFNLKYEAVQAETRKIASDWAIEASIDMQNFFGQDAEQFLMDIMARELQVEVDRSIVNELLATAASNTFNQTWSRTPASGLYPADSAEYIRTLITKINYVSSNIFKYSFVSEANYIVVPPDVIALISTLPEYVKTETPDSSIGFTGVLAGKYRVYVNNYQNPAQVLVGYQGQTVYDTGYVYAPYVPFSYTPPLLIPDEFKVVRGAYQRFAKKLVRSYYYGLVNITW